MTKKIEFDQPIRIKNFTPAGWYTGYNAEENQTVLTALKENGKTVYKPGLLQ